MDTIAEKFYGKRDYWEPRTQPMEVSILEKKENMLKIKIKGEKHTLFSPLRKELLNDDDIVFAAYRAEHPLFETIIFEVKTETKSPFVAIQDAVERMKEKLEEAKQEFKRTFERGLASPEFIRPDKWEELKEKS